MSCLLGSRPVYEISKKHQFAIRSDIKILLLRVEQSLAHHPVLPLIKASAVRMTDSTRVGIHMCRCAKCAKLFREETTLNCRSHSFSAECLHYRCRAAPWRWLELSSTFWHNLSWSVKLHLATANVNLWHYLMMCVCSRTRVCVCISACMCFRVSICKPERKKQNKER